MIVYKVASFSCLQKGKEISNDCFCGFCQDREPRLRLSVLTDPWECVPEKLSATKTSLVLQSLLCTSCVLYIPSLGRIKCRVCHFLVVIEVPVLFKVQTLEKETNRQQTRQQISTEGAPSDKHFA